MLCLTCKRLSSPGSLYCTQCPDRRSFNGVICGNGHRSPVGTRTCGSCGNSEFSEHTWGLPTGWIAKVATLAILVYGWKFGLAHGDKVLPVVESGAALTFAFLMNSDANALSYVLRTIFHYSLLGWMIGLAMLMLPQQGWALGRLLRGIPGRYWQLVTRYVPRLLSMLWRGVVKLSGLAGGKASGMPSSKGKTGKEG